MTPMPLVLSRAFYEKVEADGASAYPNECCGIMFGNELGSRRTVQRLQTVANAFESDEQYHRFSISAQQLMQAEKDASANGQLVLGFYHSHPDHPARPSEYDRAYAWPFYSYVIVSISQRVPVDMTSWMLDEQTELFVRQDIVEE